MSSHRPRIHWVSPLPPAETDIAHYTRRILPALAEATDLTLWTDAAKWDKELEQYAPVKRLDPDRTLPRDFTKSGLGDAPEAIFVNIGNSWVFHAKMLRFARRVPSIIVLHDLAIQEMCIESIHNRLLSSQLYEEEMRRWHGPAGAQAASDVLRGTVAPREILSDMPGFHITLDRASAVLAHTPAAFDAVAALEAVPAYLLDLPFAPSAQAADTARAPDGPLKFAQFGYIGPNRRLEEVIESLGPIKDSVAFEFDIFGKVWDPKRIMALADHHGLADRIRIHGFVEEAQLDAALREAHLVFNLRYPTMGEASGSQLRIWNAGAAAVVTDLGWYGTLPNDTVFKIPLATEAEALRALVQRLDADRSLGAKIGQAGQQRLRSHHTPALYAQGIAQIARQSAADDRAALLARRARAHLSTAAKTPKGDTSPLWQKALASRLER